MPDVLMILAILRLVSPLRISPLRPRSLEPLKRLDDREELRRWNREPHMFGAVILPWNLGDSVPLPLILIKIIGSPRISVVVFTSSVLVVSTHFPFIFTVFFAIRCSGDRSFSCGHYVIFKNEVLVSPLVAGGRRDRE